MNHFRILPLLFLVLTSVREAKSSSEIPGCSANTPPQSVCRISYENLRPTQFAVGMKAVEEKIRKIRSMGPKKLEDYLRRKEVPAVVHRGNYYMIDHHHLLSALHRSGTGWRTVYVRVLENWAHPDIASFWKLMAEKNYCRLVDAQGNPAPPEALPRSIGDLEDDPYRSLAYFVRERGGFMKTSAPFVEFVWADFFRSRIPPQEVRDEFEKSIQTAMRLARSREARSLPGYVGETAGTP